MARKSDQFVFSGERPSTAAAEIPIAFNNRRQPPVSHQPPRPQQLPDLSPAAERRAPTLEIPVTFTGGLPPHPPPPRPRTAHVPSVDSGPPQPRRGPQQLPDLSPAAERRAPILGIPITFTSGLRPRPPPPRPRTTHDSSNWVPAAGPANEEWSPVDDEISRLPDTIDDVVYGSAQRMTNHWWRMSEDQHSGLPRRLRPPITDDNSIWVPAAGRANEELAPVDDEISRLPDTIDDVVYGSAQRIITNNWWRMSEDQHSGLPPRPRPRKE